MELTQEMIEKAKKAGSIEELMQLAKENEYPLTEEDAKEFFDEMHPVEILAEDELDNVVGGTCYSSGTYGPNGYQKYAIVTAMNHCYGFSPVASYSSDECAQCKYSFVQGPTMYCAIRTKDHDPHKQ